MCKRFRISRDMIEHMAEDPRDLVRPRGRPPKRTNIFKINQPYNFEAGNDPIRPLKSTHDLKVRQLHPRLRQG